MTRDCLVVVRGGGDLGTGVAHRLSSEGYRVAVLEIERPRAVRRAVAFAEAVYTGEVAVEGLTARRVEAGEANERVEFVPVIVDPDGETLATLSPDVVVDARMAKRNLGTRRNDAPVTVALGPGFEAGTDVDFVIETARGDALGRVIERGAAIPDTGVPGEVGGATSERLLRSPAAGAFHASVSIGDLVRKGDEVVTVSGVAVTAAVSGIVRGLAADGLSVGEREKLGDVDPRGAAVDPLKISDKARAVGEAVLRVLASRGIMPARR